MAKKLATTSRLLATAEHWKIVDLKSEGGVLPARILGGVYTYRHGKTTIPRRVRAGCVVLRDGTAHHLAQRSVSCSAALAKHRARSFAATTL